MNYLGDIINANNGTFTTPTNAHYMRFRSYTSYGTDYLNDICINISSNRNGEYEPYTSSTLSLPISTYFPTGMKSAGSVYDELTESKAITRIGAVDLGTLNYTKSGEVFYATVSGMTTRAQAKCSKYEYVGTFGNVSQAQNGTTDGQFGTSSVATYIFIHDSTFSDATAFKSAMTGVYLYYELATPTETSFTTASLVTENGEVALANENGVLVGKCNSDVSADAGFIEGKIKLSDEDGDVYSNKIQIHVERSPQ